MGMKVTTAVKGKFSNSIDVEALVGEITRAGGRASAAVSASMKDEGVKIRDLARDYAPYDEGKLEAAIKVETPRKSGDEKKVVVFVDEMAEGSGGPNGEPRRVGEYALLMHEGLEPYGPYKLGPKSQIKQMAGFKVGGKFLERAFTERARGMVRRLGEIARKALGK